MKYNSDKWLIVDVGECYKVFATWSGGYLDGDSWKVNSGITKIEIVDDYYHIYGLSGSVYECHKNSYGTTSFGAGILEKIDKDATVIYEFEKAKEVVNEFLI